ncbi:class I SAM-dependent methyltransferase [Arthrobacter methylotrophus]|uniref:Class I SAM-dependent methyltransferase n=1 Tax=Arthrobacter methylotrophus TaxID=121291 RepID=A0ABV5UWE6_9MICC
MTSQHPRFARAYARAVPAINQRGGTEHRRSLLAGLRGRVIEIGAGEGSSFGLYPATVERVLGIEPDDYLRGLAAAKAKFADIPVTVVPGAAENIPAADGEADAVVVSLVLCSVVNQATALAEIRRVLRPGGTLAFYEHVRSNRRVFAVVEDLLTPAWERVAGGCHPNRETLQEISAAGFQVLDAKRFGFSAGPLSPPIAHILGRAMSPAEPR